ncbi:MAG TPA: hypothetical protein VN823_09885, partial [Stellaceae bacterium]|nr:hypothetical protein [Stellaceae bacterium]
HCAEYCNTLGWFYDTFDHPQRLKLLYVAAAYVNQAAWHQANTGDLRPRERGLPAGADQRSADNLLDCTEAAVLALDGPESVAWSMAFLDRDGDRRRLARRLARVASSIGNDPHNQEIALCLIEDYGKSASPRRDRLLLAAAQHTARHRKYGDFLDTRRRFDAAMGAA